LESIEKSQVFFPFLFEKIFTGEDSGTGYKVIMAIGDKVPSKFFFVMNMQS